MRPTNHTDESIAGVDSETNNADDTSTGIRPLGAGDEVVGALELEYPNGRGLYSEVFGRYDAEIADALIDTPVVRMLVELEFNLRRVESLLIACEAVPSERVESVEECRVGVEAELWATCDALEESVQEEWFATEGESEWKAAGEFF